MGHMRLSTRFKFGFLAYAEYVVCVFASFMTERTIVNRRLTSFDPRSVSQEIMYLFVSIPNPNFCCIFI